MRYAGDGLDSHDRPNSEHFCMRILTALTYYLPHWTGLTRYAALLAEGMAARGHDVTVLASQHTPSLALESTLNGVRVKRLPSLGRLSRGQCMPSFPMTFLHELARCDIVQIHTPLLASGFIAAMCVKQGKPFVLTHHGDLRLPGGFINSLIARMVVAQMTYAMRHANVVVTYSEDYARHSPLLSQCTERLATIPPPIPPPDPDHERAHAWKCKLGLEEKRIIGFAGRFVEEKGFDILLRAIPLIVAREPRAHFVFAGETAIAYERFFDKWRQLWDVRYITSLGLLQDAQQLGDFYSLCDVFTLPSRSDCFALVQAEAMLCGTPVVATDIPGARVAVQSTGAGLLVAPEDPASLAEGVLRVLSDPSAFKPHADRIAAVFDPVRTLTTYESVYRQMGQLT